MYNDFIQGFVCKKNVTLRMKLSDFPSEILLDIFYRLTNAELDNVRQAFPELSNVEESLKVQKTRIIVPFIRKFINQDRTDRKLNQVLIKLFRKLTQDSEHNSGHDILVGIFITFAPRCSADEKDKLKAAYTSLGKRFPRQSIQYRRIGGLWYYEREIVGDIVQNARTTPERIKANILKRKSWIENITTKTWDSSGIGIPCRTDMLYFTNMYRIIKP